MTVNRNDAFRLSRVEAEGWNTAQRILAGGAREMDDLKVADFNPYFSDPARARWLVGFHKAVAAMEGK